MMGFAVAPKAPPLAETLLIVGGCRMWMWPLVVDQTPLGDLMTPHPCTHRP